MKITSILKEFRVEFEQLSKQWDLLVRRVLCSCDNEHKAKWHKIFITKFKIRPN